MTTNTAKIIQDVAAQAAEITKTWEGLGNPIEIAFDTARKAIAFAPVAASALTALERENHALRVLLHKELGKALANDDAPSTVPTVIGTPFGGGYYAGRITIDGKEYALVVSPKAEGEARDIQWQPDWNKTTPGARSLNDGFANSETMNSEKNPAAHFCRRLTIAGFTDWYLPSRDELEMLYRAFKPSKNLNFTYDSREDRWSDSYNGTDENGNGHNSSSIPPGDAYTASSPEQTSVELFQAGGSEAFSEAWYWSSTEFATYLAWVQDFDDGDQGNGDKNDEIRCRAVRKVLI